MRKKLLFALLSLLLLPLGLKAQRVHVALNNGSLVNAIMGGQDTGAGFSALWRHEQLSLSMTGADRDSLLLSGEIGIPSSVFGKHRETSVGTGANDSLITIIGGHRPSFIVVSLPKGYRITGYKMVLSNDLIGADVSQHPALSAQAGDQVLDDPSGVLLRGILHAVRNHGGHHLVLWTDHSLQLVQGLSHRVIQRGAPSRPVVLLRERRHRLDGHAVPAGLYTLDAVPLEGHDGHIVALIRELLLVPPDAAQHLVHAGQGRIVDGRHASAFVKDDYVVDVHGSNHLLVSGAKLLYLNPVK